jgi:Domain of unknown function (DUF4160)
MYAKDHEPAHFHAHYQGFRSVWSIEDTHMILGGLPPRIERIVKTWAAEHRIELIENWKRCSKNERPKKITPL